MKFSFQANRSTLEIIATFEIVETREPWNCHPLNIIAAYATGSASFSLFLPYSLYRKGWREINFKGNVEAISIKIKKILQMKFLNDKFWIIYVKGKEPISDELFRAVLLLYNLRVLAILLGLNVAISWNLFLDYQ